MKSMNISLPDSIGAYVEEQVSICGYSTASDYFCHLILQDQKRHAQERLESLLLEGLNSGSATPFTEKDWEDIRQAVRSKISPQKGLNCYIC